MAATRSLPGPVGVWSNRLRYHEDRAAVADAAAELDELGYGALWLPDVGGDVLGDVEHVLDATRRCAVATGILNIWMHEAPAVAAGAAALEERHPRPLPGRAGRQPRGGGRRRTRGVRTRSMVAYLDALDAARPPLAPGDRLLAALRPRMLELSRDRAAGAHPYLVPVAHTPPARRAARAPAGCWRPSWACCWTRPDGAGRRAGARRRLPRAAQLRAQPPSPGLSATTISRRAAASGWCGTWSPGATRRRSPRVCASIWRRGPTTCASRCPPGGDEYARPRGVAAAGCSAARVLSGEYWPRPRGAQPCSGTIWIAPQGHSSAQMPQPLQ